ncbi:hypothetical protein LCGC14_1589400 [marine sediment metagenome]|uniref:Uncharacterized protein n=1 Tax=marine sediment metagenome TaxID=412755 RepID=A0A0F9KV33_9ZZZZ
MDIYFTYENGTCNQFQENEGGEKEEITIVVAPLRVEGKETDSLKVISGCNMWQGCNNPNCSYSKAGRMKPRFKANPRKSVKG